MVVHPDGRHLIYSLGGTVVVRDLSRPQRQSFLQGHTDKVSCIACSSSGSYLASGQSTHMGFKVHRPYPLRGARVRTLTCSSCLQADVIVWKFDEKELYCRFVLHKVRVQALAFSPSDRFLATLGGLDDGRWAAAPEPAAVVCTCVPRLPPPQCRDMEPGDQRCAVRQPGGHADRGPSLLPGLCQLQGRHLCDWRKVSQPTSSCGWCGCAVMVRLPPLCSYTLRVWEVDEKNRKIRPKDCNLGQMKRIVKCVKVSLLRT